MEQKIRGNKLLLALSIILLLLMLSSIFLIQPVSAVVTNNLDYAKYNGAIYKCAYDLRLNSTAINTNTDPITVSKNAFKLYLYRTECSRNNYFTVNVNCTLFYNGYMLATSSANGSFLIKDKNKDFEVSLFDSTNLSEKGNYSLHYTIMIVHDKWSASMEGEKLFTLVD